MNYSDLLGKPFTYGGRGPDEFDCFGLAIELHKRAGNILPDYPSADKPELQGTLFDDGIVKFYQPVSDVPQPLDIIMFQIVPRYITHCGVYVGYGRFIHIMRKTSVAVEELSSPVWQNKTRGIYRYRGNYQ